MPFEPKFTRESIVEAAFEIARRSGFAAITARSVAAGIGGSVAPIYYHFENIETLVKAVVAKIFALAQELLEAQTGSNLFENMGRAGFEFARRYPVFFRELVLKPNPYMAAYQNTEEAMLKMLDADPLLGPLRMPERRLLILKVKALQIGFQTLIANDQLPDWLGEAEARQMFMDLGNQILGLELAQKAKETTR